MKEDQKKRPGGKPLKLLGSIESMAASDEGVELEVKLNNPNDRALHYIADVRGIIFDKATGRLRVQLSDRGRQMPPGIYLEPHFRMIDPRSEALVKIKLPKTIVKLTDEPSPTGEIMFEEHTIADAVEIEMEIGWADVPFYQDPRKKSRGAHPISSWEQHSLRLTSPAKPKSDLKKK
jgi:hypothetical protein